MAINRGGLTPPSQNFAGPLICAIALGCAALCEAIEGTLLVCAVCVTVGGICYTIEQIQNQIKTLQDKITALLAKCGYMAGQAYLNCLDQVKILRDELAELTRGLADARGLGTRPSTGSSTSNPGGSPSNKPQM